MLRVALTGGLGAGKSTAARMFRALGAHVISSDEVGRELMQPGQAVYRAIVEHFGPKVKSAGGGLDRAELARLAFVEGRVEELNRIVHPAVLARQEELIAELAAKEAASKKSGTVVIVESALVFETRHGGKEGWRRRFDKVVLVTAPEELKVARFVARAANGAALSEAEREALAEGAHQRLEQQIPDEQKAALSDYVLTNDGAETELEWQVEQLWGILTADARASR
jgi:dephospho-CoA kinase